MPKLTDTAPSLRDIARGDDAQFVGRARELALFQDSLNRAGRGQGCLVLIAGESGFGKSRLLQQFGAAAAGSQIPVFANEDGVQALAARLRAANGRRRSAVLLDDLHLLPDDDLAVVRAMADACLTHRVALVACYRQRGASSALAETLAGWDRAGAALHRLPALSESEIALLIRNRSLAASIALTPNVGDEIARVSCGNPRYVHELYDELLAGAALPELIPRSARAAAAVLRARMSTPEIDVLELAAVIGERFFDDWLKHASSSGDEAIAATLQTCVDAGLFAELIDPSGAYAFRDLAVCKAIYVGIVGFRRRLLHARVADMLVASRVDAAYDEIIAEQWHAAGRSDSAAEWLARAATQAAGAHRFRDAASLCERAASHSETGSTDWSLLQERAAHYYEQAGLIANALPIREGMLSLLDPTGDVDRFTTACYALMYDYGFMGWPEKAIELARSLRGVESPAVRQIVAWAMNSLALGLLHDGFESQSRAALDEAKRVEPDVAARPKYVLASAMLRSATTPVEKTMAALASAVELSQQSPGALGAPWMLAEAASFACQLGELPAALRFAEEAEKAAFAARETSDREAAESGELSRWVTIHRTEVLLAAGELAAARDLMSLLGGMRNGGEIWDATVAALNVFIGLRAGDRALIGAYFDSGLLRRAVDRRQVDLCGLLLMGFPEVMAARGLTEELTKALRACAEQRFVDARCTIPLAIARYGPMDCVDLARSELCRRERRRDGRVAAASRNLFDAFVAKRRNDARASLEAASQAAGAYERLGWRLHQAVAIELAGDTASARDAYDRLGASQDAARLAQGQSRKKSRAYFGAALTPRERQVADLVCGGFTNASIAKTLAVSDRTVHHHVEAVFSKLGIRARWQLTPSLLRTSNPG